MASRDPVSPAERLDKAVRLWASRLRLVAGIRAVPLCARV